MPLRRVLREAAIFTLFVALSILMTWPLAARLETAVSDLGDPLLTAWILDWTSHALLTNPLGLFDAPLFHPAVMPLAYSEHFVGVALLLLPFHAAGLQPIALFNVAMLLAFALSGYGAFVLARMFTPSFAAALLAGMFFAFVSFKFDHLAHLQVVSAGWMPLMLAGLVAWWRSGRWRDAALFGAAFVMNGLTNIYYLLFAVATVGVTLIVLFFAGEKRAFRVWLRMASAIAVASLLLLPFLLPYRTVSKMYDMKRPEEEVRGASGRWSDWLRASSRSRTYGDLIPPDRHLHEHEAFPGLMSLFLLSAAIVVTPRRESALPAEPSTVPPWLLRTLDIGIVVLAAGAILGAMSEPRFRLRLFERTITSVRGSDLPMMLLLLAILVRLSLRLPEAFGGGDGKTLRDSMRGSRFDPGAWMAVVWIAAGVLGTLGLRTFFYTFLFSRIEAYQSMRAPGRWAVVAYAGLAVWVALGAGALLQRRSGWRRSAMAAMLLLAMFIDLRPNIQWEQAINTIPPVYRWIGKERPSPVVELPVDNWLAFRYMLGAAHHRVPLLNGSSGFEPPVYRDLRVAWDARDYDHVLEAAERAGAALLVVHGHWLRDFANDAGVRSSLQKAVAEKRIVFLRRFDHGVEGDFVFAFPRRLRDWQRLRAPEVPDGGGHLPAQMLARFLAGEPTYNASTFGRLESPSWEVNGALNVSGWAISPSGIKAVSVLLDEGRLRYDALRVPRPEVTRRYSWYYEDFPGFALQIPSRPEGVPEKTDVQIEITDGTGRRTRLEDQLFTWKR